MAPRSPEAAASATRCRYVSASLRGRRRRARHQFFHVGLAKLCLVVLVAAQTGTARGLGVAQTTGAQAGSALALAAPQLAYESSCAVVRWRRGRWAAKWIPRRRAASNATIVHRQAAEARNHAEVVVYRGLVPIDVLDRGPTCIAAEVEGRAAGAGSVDEPAGLRRLRRQHALVHVFRIEFPFHHAGQDLVGHPPLQGIGRRGAAAKVDTRPDQVFLRRLVGRGVGVFFFLFFLLLDNAVDILILLLVRGLDLDLGQDQRLDIPRHTSPSPLPYSASFVLLFAGLDLFYGQIIREPASVVVVVIVALNGPGR
ncbi:hypothetical protein PG996_010978 [Apiospora saccharicola]|uniref:Uncharacterized protein n=1 Tax=Apiospora saccharicola TaxID=335842 RepID=A0ABR1UDU4_9PEZI